MDQRHLNSSGVHSRVASRPARHSGRGLSILIDIYGSSEKSRLDTRQQSHILVVINAASSHVSCLAQAGIQPPWPHVMKCIGKLRHLHVSERTRMLSTFP